VTRNIELADPATVGVATGFLELEALGKRYPKASSPAVADISLTARRGEFLALLGPSGCGKTTTLRMLAGLVDPTSGHIRLEGVDITKRPPHQRPIGMVFQSYALFPHLNVAANVAYGLKMRRVSKTEITKRVTAALSAVHLEHLADRRVQALSGGQQQRVALARAMVVQPALFLMDEPLSNLDAKLRDAMRKEIRDIQQRMGITAVFVTHDQDEALTIADRVAVMSEGKLEQIGTPTDIYERPSSRFVAEFVGTANFFDNVRLTQNGSVTMLDVPKVGRLAVPEVHVDSSSAATAMLRPHQLRLRPAVGGTKDGELTGVVRAAMYFGDKIQYEVEVGDRLISVQSLSGIQEPLAIGGTAAVSVVAGTAHFIEA